MNHLLSLVFFINSFLLPCCVTRQSLKYAFEGELELRIDLHLYCFLFRLFERFQQNDGIDSLDRYESCKKFSFRRATVILIDCLEKEEKYIKDINRLLKIKASI